jgi:ubiquinone/menaquinone biosynthesis C-methylase UbiE
LEYGIPNSETSGRQRCSQAPWRFRAGEQVEFQPADAVVLPFADASFDAVVCQFGLMFFPDKPKSFSEVHRVPAGSLGIRVDSNYLQA